LPRAAHLPVAFSAIVADYDDHRAAFLSAERLSPKDLKEFAAYVKANVES
jgi:hypothetical protein